VRSRALARHPARSLALLGSLACARVVSFPNDEPVSLETGYIDERPQDASLDAPLEASLADAPSPRDTQPEAEAFVDATDAQTSRALRVFARLGTSQDDTLNAEGPALLLDGGYMGAPVLAWMRQRLSALVGARGDVVVLTPNMSDASAGWLGPFASAQTVALLDGATPADFVAAAALVDRAEVVFFTGGDQAKYVAWAGTPLMAAVSRLYARGGVVAGSSAGMIILGASVNDATKTLSENLTTPLLLADPYDARVHFTQDIFRFPPLARTMTDPHFFARDRMGRLATFMARQVADGFALPDVIGIGVDDGAALGIDRAGIGRRIASNATAFVHIVKGGLPTRVQPGTPLRYEGLRSLRLETDSDSFDFFERCGTGKRVTFDVDGTQAPPYSVDPYTAGDQGNNCP
jgi:cyanophycinase-like exopeptidase